MQENYVFDSIQVFQQYYNTKRKTNKIKLLITFFSLLIYIKKKNKNKKS